MFGDDDSAKKPKQDGKENFEAMLEASLQGLNVRFEKGDKVEAEVITIGRDDVFVSVKGKDGVVLRNDLVLRPEFVDEKGQLTLRVGDKISLFYVGTKEGLLQLSAKISSKALSDSLEDSFDFETPVEGKVTEVVNGGYRVEISHKAAFCPISQMDFKTTAKPEDYIGKKFDFIITKFEQGGRNIVVSRRKLLEVERAESEGTFIDRHPIGSTVTGKVVRMEKFGAFVQLESGVEGLVHISEIGWSRLEHPSEALQMNDSIEVKILKIEDDDRGRLKISLSRKQVQEDPWQDAARSLSVGQSVDGKIREKAHFGWLIEIRPGVVGLLPKSALKEATDEKTIEQKKVGEILHLKIQGIRPEEKRISLSLPSDQDDTSWQEFSPPSGEKAKNMGTLGDQFSKLFVKK